MESTVLSVGKSALSGAIGYASSAVADEVALQLGIQRDHTFIRNELEMMQAFLMAAHEEQEENRVVKTWVKQVRDVSYNVEDCLQDFAIRLDKLAWWRVPCTLFDRRRVAKEMKELRAQVEDVSQRNVRYRLIKGSGSKPTSTAKHSTIDDEKMSWQRQEKAKEDLIRLIKQKDRTLRVIGVGGANADLGETSILKRAYEDIKSQKEFECHAWIQIKKGGVFSYDELVRSIGAEFYADSLQRATVGAENLRKAGMVKDLDILDRELWRYLKDKSYLVVINDLEIIEEWDAIKKLFPSNNRGSRIIVSTKKVQVASSCVAFSNYMQFVVALTKSEEPKHQYWLDELRKHPESEQALVNHCVRNLIRSEEPADKQLLFALRGSEELEDALRASEKPEVEQWLVALRESEEPEHEQLLVALRGSEEPEHKQLLVDQGLYAFYWKMEVDTMDESQLIGRGHEKTEITRLVNEDHQHLQVISMWGMGGIGKTTLVRDIYESQEVSGKFEKCACVTIMRPFSSDEILRSLAIQFGDRDVTNLASQLGRKRYLIVLDDLLFIAEWDAIIKHLPKTTPSCIIVTTRKENIAKHCSKQEKNIYKLDGLSHDDARTLFMKKVFKGNIDLDKQYPMLIEEVELILRKCKGLPLAIVTIGGYLANQPKNHKEWRKLNENISAELEMNPELETIITVLNKSYDGLPYHLKSCFLYLCIFPEDQKVRRRHLVRRWTAEGYARQGHGKSSEEIADIYFMELISRSMILPSQKSNHSGNEIDSCQVHDLLREIGISKSMEENLVFRLDESCSLNVPATTHHLAIEKNWGRDHTEFLSLDLSHVRSLTVFGEWRPFFISNKMRFLRVLDLEGTSGLFDHHLVQIEKLLHLKYLSVRGCEDVFHLPDSIGNLRQLQTLDVRDTQIVKLPKSIINLHKLNNLHAGRKLMDEGVSYVNSCREKCTHYCWAVLPCFAKCQDRYGVLLPKGISRLKALYTLGVVNVGRGSVTLQDIKRLTGLRKLAMTGINQRNGQELCSVIGCLRRVDSLSIQSERGIDLWYCLHDMRSPPKKLESLKLYGILIKLPEWIQGLQNLVKLNLQGTMLNHDASMQVLGNLPNLSILRLLKQSFDGEQLHFQCEAFGSLVVLNLEDLGDIRSVIFDAGAMPKLEKLQVKGCFRMICGLDSLPSIKEVWLNVGRFEQDQSKVDPSDPKIRQEQLEEIEMEQRPEAENLKEQLQSQLVLNPKKPVLKVG